MNYRVDGPFPMTVRATTTGAELDVSRFLARAVLAELITHAAEDAPGLVAELAELADLQRSAQHQGPDSHARHEYDTRVAGLLDTYADGGVIPLYPSGMGQLREALATIAAPRPLPGQREGGAAA